MELKINTTLILILLAGYNLVVGLQSNCNDEPMDIVMILDSSNSISDKDFYYAKYSIFKAIREMKLGKDHNRVALVQFATEATLKFNLDTYTDLKSMAQELKTIKHMHGLTAIGKALSVTMTEVVPKMRPNVKRLAILFTDGVNNVYPTPQIYADMLKSTFVRIVCIGIGSSIDKAELTRIASPNSVLLMSSFHNLVQDTKRISDHLCVEPDPIPQKPCTLDQQDLVFLIDSSDSLTPGEFSNSKEFVKSFLKNVKLGSDGTRVAMLSFSESVRVDFNLNEYTTDTEYFQAIDKAQKFGTATAIGGALNAVITKVWPLRRQGIPLNIVLVTDGRNNVFPKPQIPATDLKNKGAHIITVGVGNDIDFNDLRAVSSDNKIITVLNYAELLKGVKTIKKMVICG